MTALLVLPFGSGFSFGVLVMTAVAVHVILKSTHPAPKERES